MRVISGKFKGRTLVAPKGDTRPTLDRTKETLFNILNFRLAGASVLDLFAGSGQLGIESLSRGAERAVFCDVSRDAVAAIKFNLEKIGQDCKVYNCRYADCLANCGGGFDVVFVDPPYKAGLYADVMDKLSAFGTVAEHGIVVCEHSAEDDLDERIADFVRYDQRKIGTVKFSFYKRSSDL